MWMLEYLNALLVYPGIFATENAARQWVSDGERDGTIDPGWGNSYVPVFIPMNDGSMDMLPAQYRGQIPARIYRAPR